MYYYKLIGNYVCKYEISYDVSDMQKYLYRLIMMFGKNVHSTYITDKPKRVTGKVYSKFSVKYFDTIEDKVMFEVDVIEIIKPSLYKLIENVLNGDSVAIEELYKYKGKDINNIKSVDYYYKVFQDCFKFRLVDKMNVDEYNKARDFMGLSTINLKKNKKRVL